MKSASNVFLSFCFSRMREVTICIENNIRHGCGEEASELVHLLVKATVRRSASCTYTVYPHQVMITLLEKGAVSREATLSHIILSLPKNK